MGKTVGTGKKDLGGQIDNFSVTLFLHTGKDRSGRKKCTFYVDRHDQIPFGRVVIAGPVTALVADGDLVQDLQVLPTAVLDGGVAERRGPDAPGPLPFDGDQEEGVGLTVIVLIPSV